MALNFPVNADNLRLPRPIRLQVARNGHDVPTVVWAAPGRPLGLVLVCHGGSGHKESPAVLALASALVPLGLTVFAIDGPVHGDRRSDGDLDPAAAKNSFRAAWRSGIGRLDIAQDFSAALDALLKMPGHAGLPVGYIGVSMGTAYGIPLLAEEPRISAAAIGLWSTTYPASAHLIDYAKRIRCSVWFTQQWNDEFFDRAGTAELFDTIGASDKRLVAYPGPHRELEGERLADAVSFIASRLLGEHSPALP